MATLQDDGRIGECALFISRPLHLAWGRGDPAWDTTPEPEPKTAAVLVDEIARRTVTQAQFVSPAENGEIELPDGQRYTASQVPTKWAHVRALFDYRDAEGETIREYGLFFDTQTIAGLPAGLRYFTPAQVAQRGRLKVLQRVQNKIVREAGVRETFEFVIPF